MGLIYMIEYMLSWIYYYLGWDDHPEELTMKSITYYPDEDSDPDNVYCKGTYAAKNKIYYGFHHSIDSVNYIVVDDDLK